MSDDRAVFEAKLSEQGYNMTRDGRTGGRDYERVTTRGAWDGWCARATVPIDMALYCPACGMQHVDGPSVYDHEGTTVRYWENRVHRSHLCRPEDGGCGHIWRPADVPTNGVQAVKTKGKDDKPVASRAAATAGGVTDLAAYIGFLAGCGDTLDRDDVLGELTKVHTALTTPAPK